MTDAELPDEPFVPAYAGHRDVAARRLSDQQVRAWVGEMLAALAERVPAAAADPRYDVLLARCEFGDQRLIRALEDSRFDQPELAGRVEAADRALVETARRGATAAAADIDALLDDLAAAFDRRERAIIDHLEG